MKAELLPKSKAIMLLELADAQWLIGRVAERQNVCSIS
jgi:hypothetical protein